MHLYVYDRSHRYTYYRCTFVIQHKTKTWFGRWIHDVLAHYINLNKKLCSVTFSNYFLSPTLVSHTQLRIIISHCFIFIVWHYLLWFRVGFSVYQNLPDSCLLVSKATGPFHFPWLSHMCRFCMHSHKQVEIAGKIFGNGVVEVVLWSDLN